jgi:bifunctional non-homologous end joining protein LigD
MEKTSLYYKDSRSDKEYHVSLSEGTVTVQYGRRGNALTSLVKCENCTPDKALKVYNQLINEKKAKGYNEGSEGVAYSTPTDSNYVGYKPQLLNEIDEDIANQLILNDDWLMQEKEDGRNIGVIFKDGKAIASNKKGLQISIPEKIIHDIEINIADDVTFCGELVGEVFKCWDAIDFSIKSGKSPYIDRYLILQVLMGRMNSDNIKITKTATTQREKIALFKEMKEKNAEGVVFKRKDSLYKAGRPNSGGDHLKFKFRATCSVIAGEQRKEGKRSVEMWLYDGPVRVNVGSVTVYPNQEMPKIGQVLEIKYLYAYKGGSLFQPVLKEFRDDVEPDECTISQLKYKRDLEEEE